jgi:hypothetical protein
VPFDYTNTQTVQLLFEVGEKEQALKIANTLSSRSNEVAEYYLRKREYGRDLQIPIVILGELQRVLFENGETDLAEKLEAMYNKHAAAFQNRSGVNRSDF